jgi:hypothetical protein
MSARAIPCSNPITRPPARAMSAPNPKPATNAAPTAASNPKMRTPARVVMLESIRSLGGLLDDLEQARKSNGLRIGAIERSHGSAFPALHAVNGGLERVEHEAELALKRLWRTHPLAPWAKGVHGLGEKSIARLIALIGDPADRVNPAKLFAYCGHGKPARRAKGMTQVELFALGKPRAKSQVWLISCSFIKCGNPEYRAIYDEARERVAEKRHEAACKPCKAKAGDPWKPGHQQAHALRVVGRAFLLDLWIEARAGHEDLESHHGNARAGHVAAEPQEDNARAGQATPDPHSTYARAGQPAPESQHLYARAGQAES